MGLPIASPGQGAAFGVDVQRDPVGRRFRCADAGLAHGEIQWCSLFILGAQVQRQAQGLGTVVQALHAQLVRALLSMVALRVDI